MFEEFSKKFYQSCVEREYRLPNRNAETYSIADTVEWTLWKAESAGLCFVRVIDADRANLTQINSDYEAMTARLGDNLERFRHVICLYVLVTQGEKPEAEDAEAAMASLLEKADSYYGQPVYNIFWRVRLEKRSMTVSDGQPKELNGLHGLIQKAMAGTDTALETPSKGITFSDIKKQADEASPYQPVRNFTVCTYVLLAINALVLLLMYGDGYPSDSLTPLRFGAILPERVFNRHEYYRLFTAMFVHFGIAHFAMNAFGLLIFGGRVERYLGHVKFIIIYLLSGISGAVFSLFLTRGYAAGASGAIYGLLGVVLSYTLIARRSMERLDAYVMIIFIGMGVVMGLAVPNIDNWGHIGGLLMGLLLGILLIKRGKSSATSR